MSTGTKGVYVISFSKDNVKEPMKAKNHEGIILPEDMPKLDIAIKGGDYLEVQTRNGKVRTASRNGRKIDKRLIAGKTAQIEKEERNKEEKEENER